MPPSAASAVKGDLHLPLDVDSSGDNAQQDDSNRPGSAGDDEEMQMHTARWGFPSPQIEHGKEALMQATKDLMSLQQPVPTGYEYPQYAHSNPNHQQQPQQNYASFPFLTSSSNGKRSYSEYDPYDADAHGKRIRPSPTPPFASAPPFAYSMPAGIPSASSSINRPSTASSTSSTHSTSSGNTRPSSSTTGRVKRPLSYPGPQYQQALPAGYLDVLPAQVGPSARRPSMPAQVSRPSPPSMSPPAPPKPSPVVTTSNKPPLLSPSQKKANHIQSEQKRRANIRKGYEALCEAVPALREAIKAMEAEGSTPAEVNGSSKKTKGAGSKTKGGGDKGGGGGDKTLGLDGRAGPKSENVVLMKTIEYIHTLLGEHNALRARLAHAHATLDVQDPHKQSDSRWWVPLRASYVSYLSSQLPHTNEDLGPAQPGDGLIWEREWRGGSAADDGGCDGEGEGEDAGKESRSRSRED